MGGHEWNEVLGGERVTKAIACVCTQRLAADEHPSYLPSSGFQLAL